ncbi:MAG: hypothetical protein FWC36_00320 [Spirochaetes bacterium]|nr:hypothetical protein [Spirochaetota bacterium]
MDKGGEGVDKVAPRQSCLLQNCSYLYYWYFLPQKSIDKSEICIRQVKKPALSHPIHSYTQGITNTPPIAGYILGIPLQTFSVIPLVAERQINRSEYRKPAFTESSVILIGFFLFHIYIIAAKQSIRQYRRIN